ncbi:MAG: DUF1127 domain-containing protein [Alphaproteobacteria bacterium]|nr:DUF1127 domain-containing protein [Alphaproteobacteria bacterium]
MYQELNSTARRVTTDARRSVGAIDHIVAAEVLRAEATVYWFSTIGTALDEIVERLRNKFGAWRRRRATYRELLRLDDRTLADIGLTRYDIELMAAGHEPRSDDTAYEAAGGRPKAAVVTFERPVLPTSSGAALPEAHGPAAERHAA